MFENALLFLKELDSLGYEGYIVGGFSRDYYQGMMSEDIDICTNMKPEEIKKHFRIVQSFEKLGSFKIFYHDFILEVTTYRKEGEYLDKRRPNKVIFVDSLEEDLQRRDFIINTLCIDKNGNYVDLLGAKEDIDKKYIRTVGDCKEKLLEDPVRMIRAIRFSIDLGFQLDQKIVSTIEQNKDLLKTLSSFRKREELKKCKNQEKLLEFLEK